MSECPDDVAFGQFIQKAKTAADVASYKPGPNGSATVSSINDDGSITDIKTYVHQENTVEPKATGVQTFAEVVNLFANMKAQNIAPFVVMHHECSRLVTGNASEDFGYYFKRAFSVGFNQGYPFDVDNVMPEIWDDSGTSGWDWSVRAPKTVVAIDKVGQKGTASDYILVGHATAWDELTSSLYKSASWAPNFLTARWLYAHKSICYECPAKEILKLKYPSQTLYCADVTNLPGDVSSLYYPLGFFGSTNTTKFRKCIAVLKPFLKAIPWIGLKTDVWEGCCGGPAYFLYQGSRGSTSFINTLTVKYAPDWNGAKITESYDICITVDEAIDNWISCALNKSTPMNSIFQSFMIAASNARNEVNTSAFMRAFCNTSLESITYPDVCACLGRVGIEQALRRELGTESARMVCQSKACVEGDDKVYKFVPSTPCTQLSVCKLGIDLNAAQRTMSNILFICGGIPQVAGQPDTAPPPGAPGTPPPPGAPGTPPPPPAGSTTPLGSLTPVPGAPAPALDNITSIILGSVFGSIFLIIVIVVTVVLVRKKRRAAAALLKAADVTTNKIN